MVDLAERVRAVRTRIAAAARRAGRDRDEVTLIAVTKGFPLDVARAALAAGLRTLGESRVQEAREKVRALPGAEWHLVGSLQRNKAKEAVALFSWIHSLDRLRLAADLGLRAVAAGRTVPVLVQVNAIGEASKRGVAPDAVETLVRAAALLPGIRIGGLMTIAPVVDDPEEARPAFRALRLLRDRLAALEIPGVEMRHLSMGMTDDFEVAVEEGATMVRIGRALFGERP